MTRREAGHERVVGGGEQVQRDGTAQAAGRLGHDHAPQGRQRLGHVPLSVMDNRYVIHDLIFENISDLDLCGKGALLCTSPR